MFDTNFVAKKIKEARVSKNMTQMDLADAMGVSFQAVSNWERGNSMPDISKISELCQILDLTFEELVGETSKTTGAVKKIIEDKDDDITLDELSDIAPILPPKKLEKIVSEKTSEETNIDIGLLIGLAPFLDEKSLDELAEKVAVKDFQMLIGLAPFLSAKTLDKLVEKFGGSMGDSIIGLAPFLSKKTLSKFVERQLEKGNVNTQMLMGLCPFLDKSTIFQAAKMGFSTKRAADKDREDGQLDELEEEDVRALAEKAVEREMPIEQFLDYLDEDAVAELANKALEKGQSIDVYLNYMDEDAVAELAEKAVECGHPIEAFLDYLDEDTMKKLLMRMYKK